MASTVPVFSIIIPTRNHAEWLSGCFDSLAALEGDRSRFEVIAVDNNSRDGTKAALAEEVRSGRLPLRAVREEREGPSHSRNTGVRSSTGKFVLFLDDDARVEPGWLAAYERCFSSGGCVVVQGRVVPEFMAARPSWLTDDLAAFLGRVDEGEAAGPLRGNMNSCNMGVARGVFESIGGFRTDLGPGGIGMAEDTEFGLRAAEKGFAPAYEPDALARHLIPPERTTRKAMIRRLYRSGLSQPVFRAYRESLPRTLGYFARRSVVRLAVAAFTLSGARRMRELCGLAEHAGRVRQLIRMKCGG
jgi:glycosyltransferase involved in cell wall biosynthesis